MDIYTLLGAGVLVIDTRRQVGQLRNHNSLPCTD